jgi:hypothetical protein
MGRSAAIEAGPGAHWPASPPPGNRRRARFALPSAALIAFDGVEPRLRALRRASGGAKWWWCVTGARWLKIERRWWRTCTGAAHSQVSAAAMFGVQPSWLFRGPARAGADCRERDSIGTPVYLGSGGDGLHQPVGMGIGLVRSSLANLFSTTGTTAPCGPPSPRFRRRWIVSSKARGT